MASHTTRYSLGGVLLAILWIIVYWWTPGEAANPVRIQRSDDPTPVVADVTPPAGPSVDENLGDTTPPSASDTPAAATEDGVIEPTFRDYTVRRGDDAWSISESVYGTRRYASSVMQANPTLSFDRLRAGDVIRVPDDPANIQGLPTGETAAPPPPVIMTYTVGKNDTLTGIAHTIYGRASLWTAIRDANRDQLKRRDGTDIRPGMQLVIPPPPAP